MSLRRPIVLLAAAAAALLPATPSPAVPHVVISQNFAYEPNPVVINEADTLQYVNLDLAPHNVVSLDLGPDGQPLFSSDTIIVGTTPVVGVDALGPGDYPFICTIHPFMEATLEVEPAVIPSPSAE